MESITLEKSTNKSVGSRFFTRALSIILKDSQKLWIDDFENRSGFPKEFSRFQIWYGWEAKQDIINLSSYSS